MRTLAVAVVAGWLMTGHAQGGVSLRLDDMDVDGDGNRQGRVVAAGTPFTLELWIDIDPPLDLENGVGAISFFLATSDQEHTRVLSRGVNPDSKVMANTLPVWLQLIVDPFLYWQLDWGGFDNPYDEFDPDHTGPTTSTERLLTMTLVLLPGTASHVDITIVRPILVDEAGRLIDLDTSASTLTYTITPEPAALMLVTTGIGFLTRRRRGTEPR